MTALTLPLLAAAALAPAQVASDLPGLFVGACMDGSVSLSGWRGREAPYEALPAGLRKSFGQPASAKVYELESGGKVYLYVLDYEQGGSNPDKVCGLAARTLSRSAAADAMNVRIEGVSRGQASGTISQWYRPQDGYIALVTSESGFTVLQVTWLTDKQKEQALRAMRPLGGSQ